VDQSAERAPGTRADEESEVRRLLRDTYPEAPEDDPPGQAELLAWIAREMDQRLRLDRLWVLAVALPLKALVLRRSLRAGGPIAPAVGGGVVTLLTVAVLRYMLRSKP